MSPQLGARGASWWAVAKRKEKMRCDNAGGSVGNLGRRAFGDRNREQRDPGGGKVELRASSVAVAEAAALPRLAVAALIVVRVPGPSVRRAMPGRRRVAVGVSRRRLRHREAAMHGAGVQLHRLGQTNGEPERKHGCETA